MKTIFLLIGALSFGLGCQAQEKGAIKLYGYVQSVSGGKAPEMNETTGLRTSGGSGKNYRLYTVSPKRIYPSELWIEGVRYGVSTAPVTQTPVVYGDDNNIGAPKKVLVPKTSGHVLQLGPVPATEGKSKSVKAKSLASKNAVVLVYKQGGTFYYKTLPSLSDLGSTVTL